jgi:hypothetical protein
MRKSFGKIIFGLLFFEMKWTCVSQTAERSDPRGAATQLDDFAVMFCQPDFEAEETSGTARTKKRICLPIVVRMVHYFVLRGSLTPKGAGVSRAGAVVWAF